MPRAATKKRTDVILGYKVDQQSLAQAEQSARDLELRLEELNATTGTGADASYKEIAALMKLGNELDDAEAKVKKLSAALRKQDVALEGSGAEVDEYGARWRQASERVEMYGDVSSSMMAVSGFARGVGLGGAADIGMLGADFTDLAEGLGRLPTALRGSADAAATAISGMTGLEVGIGAIGAAAGIAVVALGAVAIGISLFNAEQERAAENYRRYAETLEELNHVMAEGATSADLLAMRTAQLTDIEAAGDPLARHEAELREAIMNVFGETYFGMFEIQSAGMGSLLQIARQFPMLGEINEIATAYERVQEALLEASTMQAEYGVRVVEGAAATNDAISEVDRVMRRRIETENLLATSTADNVQAQVDANQRQIDALEEAREQYEELAGTSAFASEQLAETNAQLDELRATNENLIPVLEELTALEAARDAEAQAIANQEAAESKLLDQRERHASMVEDLAGIEQDAADQIASLKATSATRIDGLRESFEKFVDGAEKSITKLETAEQKKRAKIETEYMRDSQKALKAHIKEERRIVEDGQQERLQRLDDMAEDLLRAEEDNDVIAFMRAQRRGQQDIQRMDQDASVDQRRRSEDFTAEQDERKEEMKQRLRDLRDETRDRIAEIRRGMAERAQLLQQQIQEERDALIASLQQNREAMMAELQERRMADDMSIQAQLAYQERRLGLEHQLHNALLDGVVSGYNRASRTVSRSKPSYSGYKGYGGASRASMSQGGGVNLHFSGNQFGSDLTRSEVQKGLATLGNQVMGAMLGAWTKGKGA